MFGTDDQGNCYLRQLLLRSNSGRRRNGPVRISLNEKLIPPQSIKIYVDNVLINYADELQQLIWLTLHNSGDTKICAPDSTGHGSDAGEFQTMGEMLPTIVPATDKDVDNIFEYEEKEFPGSHATKERLLEWCQHDPNNFMCIKDAGSSFMAYYIIFFLKPSALKAFLKGDLMEDDITPANLGKLFCGTYTRQESLHVCVFASRSHASMFTIDLLWHLVGRILELAVTGFLSTIYAEAATPSGQAFLRRFGFQPINQRRAQGDPLFELKLSPAILREWEERYRLRTFCRSSTNGPLQTGRTEKASLRS
jgi:hypothetical protein